MGFFGILWDSPGFFSKYFKILEILQAVILENLQNSTGFFGNLGDSWRFLEILGDSWRFLEILGDSWRFLEIAGGFRNDCISRIESKASTRQ